MSDSRHLLECALDGFQTNGDIEKYLSGDDLENLERAEPRVIDAYKRVELASRDFELIVKGALRERSA